MAIFPIARDIKQHVAPGTPDIKTAQ